MRATDRSVSEIEKACVSFRKVGVETSRIEWAVADLNSSKGWDEAAHGAEYVLHIASPVPAVEPDRTMRLCKQRARAPCMFWRAAQRAGAKRVVLTSSVTAIGHGRGGRDAPFTETDWTDETNRGDRPPIFARRLSPSAPPGWLAAEGGALELTVVNPGYVLGPMFGDHFSASLQIIKKLLDGSAPALPRFCFPLVDVRDIARLHLLAMTAPQAAGRRFIGSGDSYWMRDIAMMLRSGLGDKACKVPTIIAPDYAVRLVAKTDTIAQGQLFNLGQIPPLFVGKSQARVGWDDLPRFGDCARHRQQSSSQWRRSVVSGGVSARRWPAPGSE